MADEWMQESTGDQIVPDIASGSPVPVTDPDRLTSGAIGEYTQPSRWENFWNNTRLESMDAPTGGLVTDELGAWTRGVNLQVMDWEQEADLQKKLSPEEANALYPGLEVKFTEPVHKQTAAVIAAQQQRRADLIQTMARGYQTGFLGKLAGAALAQGTDPANLMAGAAVGGVFKAAGVASTSFKMMLAEETIGNALTEFVTVPALKKEMRDYGIDDAAVNALAGGVFGAGLRKGLGVLTKSAKERVKAGKPTPPTETPKTQIHEAMPPEANRQAVATAAEQLDMGKPVDVSHIMEHQKALEGGAVNPKVVEVEDFVPYTFRPATGQVEVYAPMRDGVPVQSGEGKAVDGYVITDNPYVANNIAGSAEGNAVIAKGAIDLASVRMLDLDNPADQSLIDGLKALTKEAGYSIDALVSGEYVNALIRHAVDTGDVEPLLRAQELIKDAGYLGYRYTAKSDIGEPLHNVFEFFEHPKDLANGETVPVRREAIPDMSPDVIREAQERAMREQTPVIPRAVEETIKLAEDTKAYTLSEELQQTMARRDETLAAYENQFKNGQLTEMQITEIRQALSDVEIDSKLYERVADAVGTCLIKGGK